jgi:PAS domain S-box-containing protein
MIITGHASLDTALDSLRDSIDGYFVKPLRVEEVIKRIEEILDNRRLQWKVRESEEQYRGLVESSTDAIISVNEKREVIQWNSAASRIFGYSVEEMAGNLVDVLIPEKYHNRHVQGFAKYLESGEGNLMGKTTEVEALRKDGTLFHVEISLSALKERHSPVFTGIIRDVTRRRAMEEELQKAQSLLIRQEKLASLGTLAAGVAHEILNPLNIIGTIAQLMQLEEGLASDVKQNLEEIMAQIHRAAKITNNLRIFSCSRKTEIKPVDIHILFDKTLGLIEHDLKLENITVEKTDDKEPAVIEGDEDQLAQVFLNLLTNAKDAMKETNGGTISLRTRRVGEGMEIRFSDTGPGIPEEFMKNIFDPFFTTKDPGKGTGLGLSILHKIIEDHEGTVNVESREGKGATFVITLPVK